MLWFEDWRDLHNVILSDQQGLVRMSISLKEEHGKAFGYRLVRTGQMNDFLLSKCTVVTKQNLAGKQDVLRA